MDELGLTLYSGNSDSSGQALGLADVHALVVALDLAQVGFHLNRATERSTSSIMKRFPPIKPTLYSISALSRIILVELVLYDLESALQVLHLPISACNPLYKLRIQPLDILLLLLLRLRAHLLQLHQALPELVHHTVARLLRQLRVHLVPRHGILQRLLNPEQPLICPHLLIVNRVLLLLFLHILVEERHVHLEAQAVLERVLPDQRFEYWVELLICVVVDHFPHEFGQRVLDALDFDSGMRVLVLQISESQFEVLKLGGVLLVNRELQVFHLEK